MNIITEYTANYVKANRKNGIALFLSITAAVVLINAYIFFIYSNLMYTYRTIKKINPWDAQTYQIPVSKIPLVEQNQNVKAISIQELYYCGAVKSEKPETDEAHVTDYIYLEGGDANYWKDFGFPEYISEGRLPQNENEIIVNKLFLNKHPALKIGDIVQVEFGKRIYNGNELIASDAPISGEKFIVQKTIPLKITGAFLRLPSMDGRGNFSQGFYYFNPQKLKNDELVSVNLFLHSKIAAYRKLFDISTNLGFERNKDGSYKIFINSPLLEMFFIKNPLKKGHSETQSFILKSGIGLVVLLLIFMYLIFNVFEVRAAKRIRHIAMLKSIGASGGQIFHSIVLEALLLSVPPILAGLLIGVGFNVYLFDAINKLAASGMAENTAIFMIPKYEFGIIPCIFVILFSFIVILIATLIPAFRLSKINIIDSLKGNIEKSKKHKKRIFADSLWKKENRKNNFRSFRGTRNAITVSYILLFGLLSLISVHVIREDYKYYKSKEEMSVTYCLVNEDAEYDCSAKHIFSPLRQLSEIDSSYYLLQVNSWFLCTDADISNEFQAQSWFEQKHQGRYFWQADEGKKLQAFLYGLDDNTFNKLLASIGEDPASYYEENSYKAILVNRVQKDWRIPYRNSEFIPLLNQSIKTINCSLQKEINGKETIPVSIGRQIDTTDLLETKVPLYAVLLIMPMKKCERLRQRQIAFDKEDNEFFQDGFVYTLFLNTQENNIVPLRKTIDEIMKPQLRGENAYWSSDVFIEKLSAESSVNFFTAVFLSFMILVLFAGCVNGYASIKMNLAVRENEFAILKAVGADKKTFQNLYAEEIIFFVLTPFLYALPFCPCTAVALILRFDQVFVSNFLLNFNWKFFCFYFFCLTLSVICSYLFGNTKQETLQRAEWT